MNEPMEEQKCKSSDELYIIVLAHTEKISACFLLVIKTIAQGYSSRCSLVQYFKIKSLG